jgi:hypothetical protein
MVRAALQKKALYDRDGDAHYDLISAVHKSMRGGDPDAALYYTARMLQGGEDPRYITRRLIRFAAEDVGLADPSALLQAVAADTSVAMMGMPEAGVVIAQCVTYMALAPKSCAVYRAYKAAMKACTDQPHAPVPMHIRNAPTRLMEGLGYGQGYMYNPDHGYRRGCVQGSYLPPELLVGGGGEGGVVAGGRDDDEEDEGDEGLDGGGRRKRGLLFFDPGDCERGYALKWCGGEGSGVAGGWGVGGGRGYSGGREGGDHRSSSSSSSSSSNSQLSTEDGGRRFSEMEGTLLTPVTPITPITPMGYITQPETPVSSSTVGGGRSPTTQ